MEQKEEWRDIAGYEGLYQVSDFGRVKSLAKSWRSGKNNYLSTKPETIIAFYWAGASRGYKYVSLCHKNKEKKIAIHRIVAATFHPNPMGLPEANHLNGVKSDCRASNLEWASKSRNRQHAYDTGLRFARSGSSHAGAKLSDADVLAIRAEYAAGGVTMRKLGDKFGVVNSAIYKVVHYATRPNI